MKDTIIEMFELIDQQETKKYPDEDGNDVYWCPTKIEGNDQLNIEIDKMRSGDYTKETISSFLKIMKENEDVGISSVRVMTIERLKKIFLELEEYVE